MKKAILEKLKRLNEDTDQIYASISDLSEEKLADSSYGWSIIQVLSHLNSAETVSLQYMKKKMQAGDKMQNSSTMNSFRMWLCSGALQSSLKWKAPSYISNPPEYKYDQIKSKWAETRTAIHQFVDEYPDQWLNKLVYKHPIGGRQNLEHAVESFIYHQVHHTHQIKRIRKQLGV